MSRPWNCNMAANGVHLEEVNILFMLQFRQLFPKVQTILNNWVTHIIILDCVRSYRSTSPWNCRTKIQNYPVAFCLWKMTLSRCGEGVLLVAEVILPHFWIRPFCVAVLSFGTRGLRFESRRWNWAVLVITFGKKVNWLELIFFKKL